MKKIGVFLHNVWATVCAYICHNIIVIFSSVVAIFLSIPFLRGLQTPFLSLMAKIMMLLIGKRIKIYGKENIKKGHSYLIVANHSSIYDIVAMEMIQQGKAIWIAKRSLFNIPVFGQAMWIAGFIPIDRKDLRKSYKAIEKAIKKSENGVSVNMFPEGTRTKDGRLQRFKRGFVRLFKNSSLDILPVTLNGFYKFKGRKQWYINTDTKLSMVIHKPLSNEEWKNKNDEEIMQKVHEIIESAYILPDGGKNEIE